jgi:hypothetical protein
MGETQTEPYLVLGVGVVDEDVHVEHDARVGDGELLLRISAHAHEKSDN